MCHLSSLAISWCLHHPRLPPFMIGWSRVSPRHLSALCFTLWCSIGISHIAARITVSPTSRSSLPEPLRRVCHLFSSPCSTSGSRPHANTRHVRPWTAQSFTWTACRPFLNAHGLAFPSFNEATGYSWSKAQSPTTARSGFSGAVLLSPQGAVILFYEASCWVPTWFDATLGFPGEGPDGLSPRTWRYQPQVFPAIESPLPGDNWMQWARATMVGTLPIHHNTAISSVSSDESIHLCLLALAERGNQSSPIAARFQSRPHRLSALLGHDSSAVIAARRIGI
jgi:hypothetical protein